MTAFTSVKDGDWDDATVWGNGAGGDYPGKTTTDDTALIGSNDTVNYNIDNSSSGLNHRIRSITVGNGETLNFDTTKSTYLWIGGSTSDGINLNDNGTMNVGSSGSPLSSSYTCTIEIDQSSDNHGRIIDLTNGAQLEMYGTVKTIKQYSNGALTANSSSSISLSSVPSDWAVDDEILVQTTENNRSSSQDEIITIDSKTSTSISFSDGAGTGGTIAYNHLSGCILLNLTRNIKFIATDTSSRASVGLGASNADKCYIEYVDFNGCGSGDRGGAWAVSTQNGDNRRVYFEGCVSRNQGNDGCASPGSGTMMHKDCIITGASSRGFDSQNDIGDCHFENCYFVDNGSCGAGVDRGKGTFIDCQFWSNNQAITIGGECVAINCYMFGNSDAAVTTYGGGRFYNCIVGESEVGTQPNYNASKSEKSPIMWHDCKFASGEDFQTQNNPCILAYSSNHNQTSNNYMVDYATSTQSIEDDTSTYRTTSPSLKINPGVSGNLCSHEIPLIVESGTSYTVTLYGKKSVASPWRNPNCRAIGCGINDSATWSTADTNWNSVTLSGTATRDGVVTIFVYVYDDYFNLDDITVS